MKTIALSAFLLVAGTGSLVSAAPDDKETTDRISYGEKARDSTAKDREDPWVELASPTPASHGREFIIVNSETGPWVQLRIAAAAGRPRVRAIRIEYRDGSERVVRIDKLIDKKRPAYVDLRGPRRIERLIVVTEGSRKATYTVHGTTGRTGIATR